MKVKDFSIIKRGSSPRPIIDYLSNTGYHWLKISDFSLGQRYIYETKEFIKPSGLNHTRYVKKGTLIITNSASPGIPIFLGKDMCLHDGFLYFEKIKEDIIPMYLYYYFLANRDKLVKQGNGSVFVNLKKEILENTEINIPSLDTQQHIVNIIGSIDDLIECKFKIISNLYEYGKNLCKNLNGVEEIKLRDYINISTGKLDANKNVKDGKYPFFTCSENNLYIDDYAFDTEAILISGNGSKLGYTNFYKGKFNAYQRTYVLTGNDLFYIWFFSIKFNINKIIEQARGSAVPYITKPMLENFSISINDNNIENRNLNLNLQNIVYTILNINNEIQKLTILKQKYLNKFFG